jgi:hypothetical protein
MDADREATGDDIDSSPGWRPEVLSKWPRKVVTNRFVRHYVEMVAAMLAGMVFLYPVWLAATGSTGSGWVEIAEIELLAMATAMVVPMVGWMWHRGHTSLQMLEMGGAMYAGFIVLFPFLWTDLLNEATLTVAGHVLMLAFMLIAMLRQRARLRSSDASCRAADAPLAGPR